jgi:hypothetical protein
MSITGRVAGLGVAMSAAIAWVFGMVVWEPVSEPARPWTLDTFGENNTYWARDLRWALIMTAVAGVIVAVGGSRRRSLIAVAGGVVWLVVDALCVRIAHGHAVASIVIAAVFVLAALWLALYPGASPGRGWLVVATYVCAVLVPTAAGMESPTDSERDLFVGGAVTAVIALLAMVAGALAAAPSGTSRRAAAAVVVTLVAGGLIGLERADDGSFLRAATLGLISLAGAWALTRPRPKLRELHIYSGVFIGIGALALGAVFVVVLCSDAGAPLGQLFTWIAGAPPINDSDTDMIESSVSATMGILFGLAAALSERNEADNARPLVRPAAFASDTQFADPSG